MLKIGDGLICRIRSQNKEGWSQWSKPNSPFKLANCTMPWLVTQDVGEPGCKCKRSCRATGCGGCCNHQTGTYWNNVAGKACCALRTCSGCDSQSTRMTDKLHRHKYCHVHAEDKNRTRRKTRWEMQTVTRKQQVLRPHNKTVKRLVL